MLALFSQHAISSNELSLLQGLANTISQIVHLETAKEAKLKLESHLQQAQKMEAIGRLSSSISHEFGNPLIGVHWLLKEIKEQFSFQREDTKMVDVALEECQRMRNLLKDLQNFSRPTTGQKELFDIHEPIEISLFFYKKLLKDKKIHLVEQYDRSLPRIMAVKDQIYQVFVNLVMNAIDAMPDTGGTITVITALTGDRMKVTVQDNGAGIEEKHLEHIFEPFYSTKPEVEGIGLGLYVSYGIMKSYGGMIKFESKMGEGTSCHLVFPIVTGT